MKWFEVSIKTTKENIEFLSNLLIESGANGTSIIDSAEIAEILCDLPIDQYASNNLNIKEEYAVKAYFSLDTDINNIIDNISSKINKDNDSISYIIVDDNNWKNNWKEFFKPFRISKRVKIIPSWEVNNIKMNKYDVIMEPGMAFGTGTHETTNMCAKIIDKYIIKGDDVIDIGCGTGILSIISKKLGAKNIYAIDLDKSAIIATKQNVVLNKINDINILFGELSNLDNSINANIIVVNIIADIVIELTNSFKNYLKKNGIIICSGIIKSREKEVVKALIDNGYTIKEIVYDNGWVAIVANA